MKIFDLTKKSRPFLDLFWSKICPFLLKNQVFGHFLRIRTSDLSKTWSETRTIDLNHRMPVLCLRKFLFWLKNTLLVVTLYGFGLFLVIFFQIVDDFLLIFGSPDVFRLRKEPINSLSYVR